MSCTPLRKGKEKQGFLVRYQDFLLVTKMVSFWMNIWFLLVWKGSKNRGHLRSQVLALTVEDIVLSQDSDSWKVYLIILQFDWLLAKLMQWSQPCLVISRDISSMWPNFKMNNCGFVVHYICLKVAAFLCLQSICSFNSAGHFSSKMSTVFFFCLSPLILYFIF